MQSNIVVWGGVSLTIHLRRGRVSKPRGMREVSLTCHPRGEGKINRAVKEVYLSRYGGNEQTSLCVGCFAKSRALRGWGKQSRMEKKILCCALMLAAVWRFLSIFPEWACIFPHRHFLFCCEPAPRDALFFLFAIRNAFFADDLLECRVQSYKRRGEEIACNLVAACRLPLGRP